MRLMTAIWQKLVWCSLAGGAAGGLLGAIAYFQRSAAETQQSPLFDIVFATLAGTLLGLVVLGLPATLWVIGKWALSAHSNRPAEPARDAGHAARIGSVAAIPGAVAGAVAGVVLGAVLLGALLFLSLITGGPWFEQVSRHYLWVWFGSSAALGALTGFLAGTFVGGAAGAIFGGLRALTRS